jgi:hypothetical protein
MRQDDRVKAFNVWKREMLKILKDSAKAQPKKTEVLRFRLADYELAIIAKAAFLDAIELEQGFKERGLDLPFDWDRTLRSPSEWARNIVLNAAFKRVIPDPELRTIREDMRLIFEKQRAEVTKGDKK